MTLTRKPMSAYSLTCDQCGTTTESHYDIGALNMRGHYYGMGWRYKGGCGPAKGRSKDIDLCPACAE